MIHFSLSSYLTVHKRNEEISFRVMPTKYLDFGLIHINPNNNINKISLNIPLIIKTQRNFANFLINTILITLNLC